MKQIEVIYEDEHIVAVNKPAGLSVHPDGKTEEYVLTDWIMEHYPGMEGVGEPAEYNGKTVLRPGIVHRIDRDTSGVLVVAKDQETFLHLKRQFQEREVKKTYIAIVYDNIKEERGTIEKPIGRSTKNVRMWSAGKDARGTLREAVTEYHVLARGNKATLIELYPKTGRTHQLRVHLKAIHHPIVCDPLYAPKRECLFGLTRMALHACRLELSLPDGSPVRFEAPLPDDLREAIAKLKNL